MNDEQPYKKVEIVVTDLATGKTSTMTYHRVENFNLGGAPEIDDRDFEKWCARGAQGLAPQTILRAVQLGITGRAVPDDEHDGDIAEFRTGEMS